MSCTLGGSNDGIYIMAYMWWYNEGPGAKARRENRKESKREKGRGRWRESDL